MALLLALMAAASLLGIRRAADISIMDRDRDAAATMNHRSRIQSNESLSSHGSGSGGSGKVGRPFGRRTRLSYCQSTPAIAGSKMARRGSGSSAGGGSSAVCAALQRHVSEVWSGRLRSRNPRAPARAPAAKRASASSSSRNEEWGEIPAGTVPLALSNNGKLRTNGIKNGLTDPTKSPAGVASSRDNGQGSPRTKILAGILKPSSSGMEQALDASYHPAPPLKSEQNDGAQVLPEILPKRPPAKGVRFSAAEDAILPSSLSPQSDLAHAWDASDIPRKLRNFERIAHHRGMTVCYPASLETQAARGRAVMIRIEPSPLIGQLIKLREAHRTAVLGEQGRQRSGGIEDIAALDEVSRESSERGKEIARSSWWLKRYDYR